MEIVVLAANSKAGQSMESVFPHLRSLNLPSLIKVDEVDFDQALGLALEAVTPQKSEETEEQESNLGPEFSFELESDSDDLGEEITGELDFDEFENTLDLEADQLIQEIEKDSIGRVATPLVGMEGLQVPTGTGRIQSDEELLPGDTLDLELDLETLEGLEQLKAEDRQKEEVVVAQKKAVEEDSMLPESSNSKMFVIAILIGIVGAVAAVQLLGNEDTDVSTEKEKIEVSTNKKPSEVKPKIVEPINLPETEKNVEKEEDKVEEPEEVVEQEVAEEKQTPPANSAVKKPTPEMKLPTEKVPDKQKVIPKPKVSKPKVSKPKVATKPKRVTPAAKPKKETPKKTATVKTETTQNDDSSSSISLWGAAAATDCYMRFNSNVPNARIFLNGIGYGAKVGKKIKVVCAKKYTVKLQADGYLDEQRDVQSDATKEFYIELKQ